MSVAAEAETAPPEIAVAAIKSEAQVLRRFITVPFVLGSHGVRPYYNYSIK